MPPPLLLLLYFLPSALSVTSGTSLSPQPLPSISFSSLSTILLTGSFSGISFPSNSISTSTLSPPSLSSNSSSLLQRAADGTVTLIAFTDDGGGVDSICQDGSGKVWVGGNFTSLTSLMGVVEANNVAVYDEEDFTFQALGGGLEIANGSVTGVDCSSIGSGGNQIYFSHSDGETSYISVWSTSSNSFSALPNFDPITSDLGKINTIKLSTDGKSLLISGGFGIELNSTDGTTVASRALLEVDISGDGSFGDAENSISSFDALGESLIAGSQIFTIATSPNSTTVWLGGFFTYQNTTLGELSKNVIGFDGNRNIILPPNGGLNGFVSSVIELDGYVYAVGGFDNTTDETVTNLGGVARWNVVTNASWEGLGDGEDFGGTLRGVGIADGPDGNQVVVAIGEGTKGFGIFDPATQTWNETMQGFFVGSLTALGDVGNLRSTTNGSVFFAGDVESNEQFSTEGGIAMIGEGSGGVPTISSLNINFSTTTTTTTSTSVLEEPAEAVEFIGIGSGKRQDISKTGLNGRKRQNWDRHQEKEVKARSFVKDFAGMFFGGEEVNVERDLLQHHGVNKRQTASSDNFTLPSPFTSTTTNEILAAGFGKNSTSGDEIAVVGGSFVTENGAVNVGVYDLQTGEISPLQGDTIGGTVLAIEVVGNTAFIGGNIFDSLSGRQGLVTYSLSSKSWNSDISPLTSSSGNSSVNVIVSVPGSSEEVIVGGNFDKAGSLTVGSLAMWNLATEQWDALGGGVQGTVGALDFAGDQEQYLIVVGEFILNGTTSYVAQFNLDSKVWSSLSGSSLPGPATAVSANDYDDQNIFVAGQTLNSKTPYLMRWNGQNWTDVSNGVLQDGSEVSQLTFVPLSVDHTGDTSIIQSDRMLLVAGGLTINSTSVATALWDGTFWHPYLLTANEDGSAGAISGFRYSASPFSIFSNHHLSVGIVIIIAMAISLGIVFFLVLAGLLIAVCKRSDDDNRSQSYPPPSREGSESEVSHLQHRPRSLLAALNAATTQVLTEKDLKRGSTKPGDGGYPVGAAGLMGLGLATDETADVEDGDEEDGMIGGSADRTVKARYSFHAENPDEISVTEGEDLRVIDSSHDIWWFVQSVENPSKRGVIPASYVF